MSQNDEYEQDFIFHIPDKCISVQAPICKLVELVDTYSEEAVPDPAGQNTPPAAPSKKIRGKVPLVESEVRRSSRLLELNDGFRKHLSCNDKDCLPCNAVPPELKTKVLKNLASSFCKVDDKDLERSLQKK